MFQELALLSGSWPCIQMRESAFRVSRPDAYFVSKLWTRSSMPACWTWALSRILSVSPQRKPKHARIWGQSHQSPKDSQHRGLSGKQGSRTVRVGRGAWGRRPAPHAPHSKICNQQWASTPRPRAPQAPPGSRRPESPISLILSCPRPTPGLASLRTHQRRQNLNIID
jgi:hypothetical protein